MNDLLISGGYDSLQKIVNTAFCFLKNMKKKIAFFNEKTPIKC